MVAAAQVCFGAAVAFYFLAGIVFVANLFVRQARLNGPGLMISFLGLAFHTTGIILKITVLMQQASHHAQPFATSAEAWSFFSWTVAAIYLAIAVRSRLRPLGAFALPAALIGMLVAAATAGKGSPILAAVPTWEIVLHVWSSILSLGAFGLAFACALCYLTQDHLLKEKRLGRLFRALPPLDTLDTTSYWLVVLGFCLLTFGLISGAILAHQAWKSSWLLHPKTVGSLLLWITYGVFLYFRGVAGWRGRRIHMGVVFAVGMLGILYAGALILEHPLGVNGTAVMSEAMSNSHAH